jgi:protoporphyrinogen oxidase
MDQPSTPSVAVIGGGPMGLAIAYQLALEGCRPVLLEADDRLGGMAASFDFAGVPLEHYNHFHCLEIKFDAVISTVPLPLVAPMLRQGQQDPNLIAAYEAQQSVACTCVVLQASKPITGNFWTNVNDSRFAIPGIIEMSNLRPITPHITYVPFYVPADHRDYGRPNGAFIADTVACLKAINPELQAVDILASHCSRYRYAQPVCGTHFLDTLPPLNPIVNMWIADTTVYYPEDRGISESVGFGRDLARKVVKALQ